MTAEVLDALLENSQGTIQALNYLKTKVNQKDREMIKSVIDANEEAELLLTNSFNSQPY